MSLYHEATQILDTATTKGGSLKSIVFGKKDWKSDPKTLFALTTEAVKWSEVVAEVIEKGGVLELEKTLTPTLSLLLTHDLLLSKRGVALPQKHGLNVVITRHKARLAAELTKLRLKRGCATLDALRALVNDGVGIDELSSEAKYSYPRWIRINTLRSPLEEQLGDTFREYKLTKSLTDITTANNRSKLVFIDENIANLIAIPAGLDVTKSSAYKEGKLILQDKASCFSASLLSPKPEDGTIIDACAAPGNKSTHLAALASPAWSTSQHPEAKIHRIVACEKDGARSEILSKMVKLAGAKDLVSIKARQDFMKTDPGAEEFANVTALLLDPSCSGSGIVGRDEANVKVHLPNMTTSSVQSNNKKRKREHETSQPSLKDPLESGMAEENEATIDPEDSKLQARLEALSSFQLRILQHAMAFPNAERIVYSTCSLHGQENEEVVVRALLSDVAIQHGWNILPRTQQIEGLRKWQKRGTREAIVEAVSKFAGATGVHLEVDEIAESCIRCEKGGFDGTMGFFVAGFARNLPHSVAANGQDDEEEEWNGFSDDEA